MIYDKPIEILHLPNRIGTPLQGKLEYSFTAFCGEKEVYHRRFWESVQAGEKRWIFPYQERADVMFNTSLHYELPILKNMAYELLLQIPSSAPQYLTARRLIKLLHYFLPAVGPVMEEIPPLSILREFVGDSAFYDIH